MKRFVCLLTWILVTSGWPMATQQLAAAQQPQPADIRIDHDVEAQNWRVRDIFLYLLHGTGLHGGFAEITGCSDLSKGRFQIKQGVTVRQAMNALVAANPGYKWELNGGVVNLIPRGGAPLLQTRITKFQKDTTDQEILVVIGDVLDLPEVRERAAALGLKPGMGGIGLFAGENHPIPRQPVPVHINVQNLSLQEALNKIVQASPNAAWIYHETDCDGAKTFVVEMR